MPIERVSAVSLGFSAASLSLFSASIDSILSIDTCRGRAVWLSKQSPFEFGVSDLLSGEVAVTDEEPRIFVKSKPETLSCWYEPSAKTFAWFIK